MYFRGSYLQINAIVAGANAHVINARHLTDVVDMRCKVWNAKINSYVFMKIAHCISFLFLFNIFIFPWFSVFFLVFSPTHNIVQCGLSWAADKVRIKRDHNQTAVNGLQSNKPH